MPPHASRAPRMRSVAQVIGEAITEFFDRTFASTREAPTETPPASRPLGPAARSLGDEVPRGRVIEEIRMVAPHFERHGPVRWDEANGDWLMIGSYPLPERWRARW